jgi:hypothetical protein
MTLTTKLPGWNPSLRTDVRLAPKVSNIGFKANRYLNTAVVSGEVTVASSRAVYITTDGRNIFAVCPLDQQPHPRSLLTDLDLSHLQFGLRIRVQDGSLNFSNGVELDLRDSQVWQTTPPSASDAVSLPELGDRCQALIQAAQDMHLRESQGQENLGMALPFFSPDTDAPQETQLPNGASPLVTAGVQQVRELLPLCSCGNFETTLGLSEQLIGLGHGLTPSGDDFVGGLLFMSFHLNTVYPVERWWTKGDTSKLLERSKLLTSDISHALLTDLDEGESHASLNELAKELLTDSSPFDAAKHVRNITQIGQSSGWDMLTGMLAGLLPVIHRA